MNNKKLFSLLAESYREYTITPEAKRIGLAYVERFHQTHGGDAPDLMVEWKKFLNTPSGEREQEYLNDAGCFLAMMDTMKNMWNDAYHKEVEEAIKTNPELSPPVLYKVPFKGKLLNFFKALSALALFSSATSFLCILFLQIFFNTTLTPVSLIVALSIGLISATFLIVCSWLWRKHYARKVKQSNSNFEKYNLLWIAKFGAVPLINEERIIIPAPPFSWTKNKEDVIKYGQVTEYLKDKFVLPYEETKSRPELVLPEIDNTRLPVESLNSLKKFFEQHLN